MDWPASLEVGIDSCNNNNNNSNKYVYFYSFLSCLRLITKPMKLKSECWLPGITIRASERVVSRECRISLTNSSQQARVTLYSGTSIQRSAKGLGNWFVISRLRYIEVLSNTFYCNFSRAKEYRSLFRGLRYIEVRESEVPLYITIYILLWICLPPNITRLVAFDSMVS